MATGLHSEYGRQPARWRLFAYEFDDADAPAPFADPKFAPGAYHTAEIQYVFGSVYSSQADYGLQPAPVRPPFSPAHLRLSERIMDYWARFAQTGEPDGTAPNWRRYDLQTDQVLSLAPDSISLKAGFADGHHARFGTRWPSHEMEFPAAG